MMKKLLSSLMLALLLSGLSAFALADEFSGKDAVEQLIEPLAMQTTGTDLFTKEEVETILAQAQERGLELDEKVRRQVLVDEGYFKEELAMAFSRQAFGGDFYTWDVADQLWFEEFWIRIGGLIYTTRTVPKEGELSQEEIEAKASGYVREQTGTEYPLSDPAQYRTERSFTAQKNNPYHSTRRWSLSYIPLSAELPEFILDLTPQGELIDFYDGRPALEDPDPLSRAMRIYYTMSYAADNKYGPDDWPQEAWQELRLTLKDAVSEKEVRPEDHEIIGYVLLQSYAPFGPDTISREEAIALAAQAVGKLYKVDPQSLLTMPEDYRGYLSYVYAIGLDGDSSPVWKVSFSDEYLAEIDAKTGRAMTVDQYSPGNARARRYVLDALLLSHERAYATKLPAAPTPSPQEWAQLDQEPYFRRDDSIGNDTYWQAILDLNYTAATANRIWDETSRDYGDDTRFWPLVMQAFNDLYNGTAHEGGAYAGLPLPGDISQEEALALSAAAMDKLKETYLYAQDITGYKPAVQFLYDSEYPGSRSWHILLLDPSAGEAQTTATVIIDAPTGSLEKTYIHSEAMGVFAYAGPDGLPLVWRTDFLPEYFWALMEEKYPNFEAAQAYLGGMQGDNRFWPPEAKAVGELWFFSGEPPIDQMACLPAPDDLPQEEALEIAREVFQKEGPAVFGQEAVSHAEYALDYIFRDTYPGRALWLIELINPAEESTGFGYIVLDAKTGELLDSYIDQTNG